jgi:uncharacterized protein (TIGR02145 family)
MKKNIIYTLLIATILNYSCTSSNDSGQDSKNPEQVTITDTRDGNVYKIVTIGNQTWMAENLRYIPSVSPPNFTSRITPYYYVNEYFNTVLNDAKNTVNYKTYGVLYNWSAAMNGESTSNSNPSGKKCNCPQGWHLPSKAEFEQLKSFLTTNGNGFGGSGDDIAKSLATKTNWNTLADLGSIGNDLSTNNSSGFSVLPGGSKLMYNGSFDLTGKYADFWTTSEVSTASATNYFLSYQSPNLYFGESDKTCGYSIRCIKD